MPDPETCPPRSLTPVPEEIECAQKRLDDSPLQLPLTWTDWLDEPIRVSPKATFGFAPRENHQRPRQVPSAAASSSYWSQAPSQHAYAIPGYSVARELQRYKVEVGPSSKSVFCEEISWQFEVDDGNWRFVDEDWRHRMIAAQMSGENQFFWPRWRSHDQKDTYEIDLVASTQTNGRTGSIRSLRKVRCVVWQEVLGDDYLWHRCCPSWLTADMGPQWHMQVQESRGWQNLNSELNEDVLRSWKEGWRMFGAVDYTRHERTGMRQETDVKIDLAEMTMLREDGAQEEPYDLRLAQVYII